MFEPLKEYFRNAANCPEAVKCFFKDTSGTMFWLHFVDSQLQLSNESVLKVEGSTETSFEVAEEIRLLHVKVSNRKDLQMIPTKAKSELLKLSAAKQVEVKNFVHKFYSALHEYLNLWKNSLDGTEVFHWMALKEPPNWTKVEASLNYAALRGGDKINGKFIQTFLNLLSN